MQTETATMNGTLTYQIKSADCNLRSLQASQQARMQPMQWSSDTLCQDAVFGRRRRGSQWLHLFFQLLNSSVSLPQLLAQVCNLIALIHVCLTQLHTVTGVSVLHSYKYN